jgi:hypothetical protein
MKKILTLAFTAALALSLALPVFAQDTSSQGGGASTTESGKKAHKEKKQKTHKSKKSSGDNMGGSTEAPKQ